MPWTGWLKRSAGEEGGADGAVVEIVELAANRHTLGERGDGDAERCELAGDVVGGRLAVDCGVEGEDDLAGAFLGDAPDELGDAQRIGADLIEGGEDAAEHVVAAAEGA